MIEILTTCDACDLNYFFGVKLDKSVSDHELRARIVEKLGHDGAYICPRCHSLRFVHVGGGLIADPERLQRAASAVRIGRETNGIRFGVGEPEGVHSSVWRVWMNNRRDDVYISARSLASELKVSLHEGFWYFGFTDKHIHSGSSLVPAGADRKIRVWDRPDEFGAGWTRAFTVIVPASEVVDSPAPYAGREAVWLPKPAKDEAVHFTVLLSEPDSARGRRGYPSAEGFDHATEFVTRLEMTTGEQLWVLSHIATMTDAEAADVEQVRATIKEKGRQTLLKRASQNPRFAPRAIVFRESADGVASFVDVSLIDALGSS